MIIVTGAAGFIGSCLIAELNARGFNDIIAVDDFSRLDKLPNLNEKQINQEVHRDDFIEWFTLNQRFVQAVFHLGARTDTTEKDITLFNKLNLNYSKHVWEICTEYGIPLVYASSAATYGIGEQGYTDNHDVISRLKPLNPYGQSKQDFDVWVLQQKKHPSFWAGLKFFNVYGPNEYHKGRMASVIMHAFNQMKTGAPVKLFRSHRDGISDGGQSRDFIYVKDLIDVCIYLMENRKYSGIYNLGSGKARSFLDLAKATFKAAGISENIEFIDTPIDIRDTYQYYTCAEMSKLRQAGYTKAFTSLEDGIKEYVEAYLIPNRYF